MATHAITSKDTAIPFVTIFALDAATPCHRFSPTPLSSHVAVLAHLSGDKDHHIVGLAFSCREIHDSPRCVQTVRMMDLTPGWLTYMLSTTEITEDSLPPTRTDTTAGDANEGAQHHTAHHIVALHSVAQRSTAQHNSTIHYKTVGTLQYNTGQDT